MHMYIIQREADVNIVSKAVTALADPDGDTKPRPPSPRSVFNIMSMTMHGKTLFFARPQKTS